jgi:tetratricopeptide (TPR) repeat protein
MKPARRRTISTFARAMPNQRGHAWATRAADIYRQVIAKDARFAPAYAGLAAAYAASSAQGFRDDHDDELAGMRAAAENAIRLDPLLAEAHDAIAMVYMREGKWAQSEASFRRAIELDRSNSGTYVDLSTWLLLPLGRIDEAVGGLRKAERADPLSSFVQQRLASMLIIAGRYEEAAGHCASEPECMARVRLGQGQIDEAIQILYKFNDHPAENELGRKDLVRPRYLGYAYARAGRRTDAEKIALEVVPNAYSEALIYAGLGDKDRTLKALDRVAVLGASRIGQALNSPEFALLRGDPRVKALRKGVGLPE